MHVTAIRAYRQLQPFVNGRYGTTAGSAAAFDSLIVSLDTDEGVTGWGEGAPLGGFYDAAFAAGARAALAEIAPHLMGEDPRQSRRIAGRMDSALRGHAYAKSPLDMACWDAAATQQRVPLCEALGGRFGKSVPLYRPLPPATLETTVAHARAYVDAGYRRLQVKVGGDPVRDAETVSAVADAVGSGVTLFADANGAWTTGAARTFLSRTTHIEYTLEQPCASIAECRALRPHCPHPLALDESIDSLASLLAVASDHIADLVTIKIARVGGVTRAALLRDVAVDLGLLVTVEDTGGASIDTAAILHLSLSTPEPHRVHTVDFNNWVTIDNADGIPPPGNGHLAAPDAPGLGVTPRLRDLGEPILVW